MVPAITSRAREINAARSRVLSSGCDWRINSRIAITTALVKRVRSFPADSVLITRAKVTSNGEKLYHY